MPKFSLSESQQPGALLRFAFMFTTSQSPWITFISPHHMTGFSLSSRSKNLRIAGSQTYVVRYSSRFRPDPELGW
eukprot:CAMPEP_0170190558 /NCGR_PEP_ID=MMETSP0040_2-20121228/49611_1 /TAXON_ID=641309 /ORGANISM="Lotharella oceanica, Strain CCMP622" /LENGTH=74 /DNA_ID=CAMNT_0010438445 /DNA_START=513 /DNA_END=737 /DNA_ORIENTATION=+